MKLDKINGVQFDFLVITGIITGKRADVAVMARKTGFARRVLPGDFPGFALILVAVLTGLA